jgi:hypothetical protein
MTQRRPDLRTNVRNYRHILEGRRPPSSMVTQGGAIGQRVVEMEKPASSAPFPEYFAQTVYPVFQKLHTHGVTPDDRIIILCEVRMRNLSLSLSFVYSYIHILSYT